MRNNQAIIGIAAAVVIILGAGAVYTLNKDKSPEPNNSTSSTSTSLTNPVNEATIASIFESAENKKCTFDTKGSNSETKGTIYVSGKNAYGEFNVESNSKTQTMSLIRNGDTFYIWGSSLPQGMKMMLSVEELGKQFSNTDYSSFNPEEKTAFNCSTWAVDSSKFTPPTNVKFLEVGKINAQTTTKPSVTGTSSNTNDCSLCNSMTGAAKQACLSGLNCQ